MKNIIYLNLAIIILLLTGCDKGFEELNRNPNAPDDAQIDNLFIKAQVNTFSYNSGYTEQYLLQQVFCQQASIRATNSEILQFSNEWLKNNWAWDNYYNGQLPNISDVERRLNALEGEDMANSQNKLAMLKIVKAYCTHMITDIYGAIPYSDAATGLNSEQILTPAYDTQEQVYGFMLADLKSAAGNLTTDNNQVNFSFDGWFNGDISKWKKFANALRLRLATRISSVNETLAKQHINEILSNSGDLLDNNDDALIFYWQNYDSPSYGGHFSYGHSLGASNNLINFMSGTTDPRIGIFFNRVFDSSSQENGNFLGVPISPDARIASGLFANIDKDKFAGEFSRMRDEVWLSKKMPEAPITPAEVYFLRAEIAHKGWSNENTLELYNKGIESSIKLYKKIYTEAINLGSGGQIPNDFNVSEQAIASYIANPDVSYSIEGGLNKIQIQQWLNLHANARELYSNFRRTMVPNQTSNPALEPLFYQGTEIPYSGMTVRYRYPASEYSLNRTQVEATVASQGADVETTKLWWDVN